MKEKKTYTAPEFEVTELLTDCDIMAASGEATGDNWSDIWA